MLQVLNKVEEGTYGVVYRAIVRKTKEIVALKRLKMEKEKDGRTDGFHYFAKQFHSFSFENSASYPFYRLLVSDSKN